MDARLLVRPPPIHVAACRPFGKAAGMDRARKLNRALDRARPRAQFKHTPAREKTEPQLL